MSLVAICGQRADEGGVWRSFDVLFLAAAEVPPVFALLAIILIVVVAVSLMLARFRQSLLIGYFLCGVVVANSGVLAMYGGSSMEERIAQLAESSSSATNIVLVSSNLNFLMLLISSRNKSFFKTF